MKFESTVIVTAYNVNIFPLSSNAYCVNVNAQFTLGFDDRVGNSLQKISRNPEKS